MLGAEDRVKEFREKNHFLGVHLKLLGVGGGVGRSRTRKRETDPSLRNRRGGGVCVGENWENWAAC